MKKMLSLVLIVAMVCSLGVPAMAAEETKRDYEGHWSESSIDRWTDAGLVKGDQNGNVNADQALTRAEFATLLVRLLGLKDDPNVTLPGDTSSDAWYTEAMRACVAAGILTGDQNGNLNPNAPISRAEVIVMFGRAVGVKPDVEPDFSKFTDGDDVSDWAAGYLSAMADMGVISGVPGEDGTLSLNDTGDMDRGSVFAMMDKAVTVYITEPGKYEVNDENAIVIINVPENARVEVSGTASNVVVTAGNQSNVYATITAENVKVDSTGYLTLEEGSEVQEVEVNAPANIYNKGNLGNLVSNDSHVTYSGNKPENITAAEGTEMPTETKPTNGGGSSGGSNSSVTPANIKFGKAWDKTNNTSEGLSTDGSIKTTAKRVTVDDGQESKTVTVTTATLSAKNIVAHNNWQDKNGYWLVATFPKPAGANYLTGGVVTLSTAYSDEAFVTAADTVLNTAAYEDFSDRDGQDVLIDVAQGQVKYVVLQWQKGTIAETATAPTYEPVGDPIYAIVQPGDVSPKVGGAQPAGLNDSANEVVGDLYKAGSYTTSTAASFVDGKAVTTVTINAQDIAEHTMGGSANGGTGSNKGYWVGAALLAPEGAKGFDIATSYVGLDKLGTTSAGSYTEDAVWDLNGEKIEKAVGVYVQRYNYTKKYVRIDWKTDSDVISSNYYILDASNVTMKDVAKATYTYTFKNGTTTVATMKKTVDGGMVTWTGDGFPANPTKDGYVFEGWYYDNNGQDIKVTSANDLPNGDTTVNGKLTEKTLTVTLNANGGTIADKSWVLESSNENARGQGGEEPRLYVKTFRWSEVGADDTLPIPTQDKEVFTGWSEENNKLEDTKIASLFGNAKERDVALTAGWVSEPEVEILFIDSANDFNTFKEKYSYQGNKDDDPTKWNLEQYPWVAFCVKKGTDYSATGITEVKITANGTDITSKLYEEGAEGVYRYTTAFAGQNPDAEHSTDNALGLTGEVTFVYSFTYFGKEFKATQTYTVPDSAE